MVREVIDAIDAAEESGEPASVSTIAEALSIAQPRASKLVAEAVDAGLVCRQADQTDGRRSLLTLTDAGRALCEEVHRFRRRAFEDAMAGWPARDRTEFARLISRFVAALRGDHATP
jgi:DNA-binding MarR family transcriptional regulator